MKREIRDAIKRVNEEQVLSDTQIANSVKKAFEEKKEELSVSESSGSVSLAEYEQIDGPSLPQLVR